MSKFEKASLALTIIGILAAAYIGWLQFSISVSLQHLQPELQGHIVNVFVGGVGTDTNNTNEGVLTIEIAIDNLGSPSIVDGYNLNVKLVGATSTINDIQPRFPLPAKISDQGKTIFVFNTSTDAIYEKTAQPIQSGAQTTGWVLFVVPGVTLSELGSPGTWIGLDYQDITGKHYETTWVTGAGIGSMHYIPGGGLPFR